MSDRYRRALAALSRRGDLEWLKCPHAVHPLYGRFQAPYMAWRYKETTLEIESYFHELTHRHESRVKWLFDSSGRNWILAPERLIREGGGTSGDQFMESVVAIAKSDQSFCELANSDLDSFLSRLEIDMKTQ